MQSFSKTIETVTTVTISFDKDTILKSSRWLTWIESNPSLASLAQDVLDGVSKWIEEENLSPDFYYRDNQELPRKGDWGVDHSFNEECRTWEQARQQMGTTEMKFSVTNFLKIPHNKHITKPIVELGKFFKSLGFVSFFAFYSSWRLGYDYEMFDIDTDLNEMKTWLGIRKSDGQIIPPSWYEAHICLSIPIVKTNKKTIIRPF